MNMTALTASRSLLILFLGSTLAWGGCATTGVERAEATAETLQSSTDGIEKGKTVVKNALDALDKVQQSATGDPRDAFKEYSATVDDVEAAAAKVRKTVASMKDYAKEYYEKWQQELSGMTNEQLKAISSERQAKVQKRFQELSDSYTEVASAYKPFITDLRDIRTYLSNDLTPKGINAVKPVADKARADAADLTSSFSVLQNEFSSLAAAIAPFKK